MKKHNLPMPSFDADAPADFPKLPEEISKSRMEVIFATKELGLLAQGPRESVRWGIWEFLDVLALQVINHYGIGECPTEKPPQKRKFFQDYIHSCACVCVCVRLELTPQC